MMTRLLTSVGMATLVTTLFLPLVSSAQAPDWQVVNPSAFDASMTATAIVFVDGSPALHPDNLLAAFAGTEVRGVSTPSFVGGDQLFFLTIFGNTEGESLSIRVYDAALDEIRDVNESIEFASNAALGELNRPLSLSSGSSGSNRPAWQVNEPGAFEESMSVTASVVLDGVSGTHPGNLVAAFVGGEIRAVGSPVWVTGRQLFFLNVLGNTNGETVSFRIYDAAGGQVRTAAETNSFAAGATLGSVAEPLLLTDGAPGANRPEWVVTDAGSFETTMSIAATVFVDGFPSSNTGNVLAAFSGAEVRGVATPRLVNGVQTFFLTAFGDATTGALSFEFYDADSDRVVQINEQLSFEAGASIGTIAVPLLLTSGPPPANAPGWSVNPADYDASMSVTASLFVDGLPSSNPNSLIAAFEGESVRGVASPVLVSGVMLYYMTVYSNAAGERLTLKAFDGSSGRIRVLRETVTFRANDSVGETKVPLVLNTVDDAVDIAIGKSANITNPTVGSDVEFTVTAANIGVQQATGVVVTDAAPAGMTFTVANPSQGTYGPATGEWTVGTLDPGQSATLTVTATVNQAGSITNTASLTGVDQPDVNPGNDVVSVTVGGEQADLQITKTVDLPTANVGDQVTFVATLRNNGPSTATAITVSDQVTAGLRIDEATPSQGSFDTVTRTWNAGNLAAASEATLTVTATVLTAGAQTNTATITGSGTADPNISNNSAVASVTGEQIDISVSKTVDNARPILGDIVEFDIIASNGGPSDASGVMILDALPAGLVFVGGTPSSGTYDDVTGQWTIGNLAADASVNLTISARVSEPGVIVNTASLLAVDQPDSDSGNDRSTATVSGQQIDLAITKSVTNPRPNVGEEVTFTVTLTNNGPGNASGITISEAEAPGLSFTTVTADAGLYESASGVWTVPQLPAGASARLTVVATVDAAGAVTNTATITGSDQPDTNPANDAASRTVDGQIVDISLTKTVDRPAAAPGDSVMFTIRVRNNGPSIATGIEVTDALPAGLLLRDFVTSSGTFSATTRRWSIPRLGINEQQSLRLTTRIEATGSYTNSASVANLDQPDSNQDNNTAEATVISESVDLGVTKTADKTTADVGSTVRFTITLTNNGPTAATGVAVTDVAPAGLALGSATTTSGSFNAATGIWAVGSLNSGADATVVITALVAQAGELTNTARISAVDQDDSNPSNDIASATITASSTETLSGVVRDVVFNDEGPGSVLQSPPLASATVEILINGSVVEETTTDANGLFSFAVTGAEDRVIRITASGTVPETGAVVDVVKEIPLTDLSRAYQIPLTLAIQKRSLIYELENSLIPSSILAAGGEPVPLVISYDESATDGLLETWLVNVGPERDEIVESLARLVFAELVLTDLYTNAVGMSHESADVIFQLARAFLLTQGLADEIRAGVNDRLLTVLELRVIRQCFEELRKLIKEVFLDGPIEAALSRLPADCGPLLSRVVRSILEEASAVALLSQPDDPGIRDQITTAGDQELLGWYVTGTQADLDRTVDSAGRFDAVGGTDDAYTATRSIVVRSTEATDEAGQYAELLQQRANLDAVVERVLRHRQRERNLGNLVSLYQLLRKKKISSLGLSIATTIRQLKIIEGVDVPEGTDASMTAQSPLASVAPNESDAVADEAESEHINSANPIVGTSSALATDQYRQAIGEIARLAQEGKKSEVIARYDPLVALEHELDRSLRVAQAPIIAAAESAAGTVTNFENSLAEMVDAVTETAVERAVLYAQLLQYAGDPLFSVDSLSAQVDSLNRSLDNAERIVAKNKDLTSGADARPYVVVLSTELSIDQLSLGDTLTVSIVLQNLGTLAAEGVVATLRTDPSANPISTTEIDFGTVPSGQEEMASWSMQIVDTTRASGIFQIELVSSNAMTSSASGSYSFTRATPVGLEILPRELPTKLALFQSYPNPFSTVAKVSFSIPRSERVTVKVFDILSREIATLVDEPLLPGTYEVAFDGHGLASGTYVCRLQAGSHVSSLKMVLVR